MITNYKKVKEDVLNAYASFLPIIETVKNGKETSYDASLESLKKQAENIKQDKFLLMIVGEAKSGKSTFINAYLGEELLKYVMGISLFCVQHMLMIEFRYLRMSSRLKSSLLLMQHWMIIIVISRYQQ